MNRVCVGVVTGPHGLQGLLKIKSFTEEPGDIGIYGPLSNEPGNHHWAVTIIRQNKGSVLARLNGVSTREAAAALAGTRLFIDRSALPASNDPEDYYHADLIGLQVKQHDGQIMGVVRAIHNFGAGDILDILCPDGASLDLPFTRQWVPDIDLSKGMVVVIPPPGLWDQQHPDHPPMNQHQ